MSGAEADQGVSDQERVQRIALYDVVREFLDVGSPGFPRAYEGLGFRPHYRTVNTYGLITGLTRKDLQRLGQGGRVFSDILGIKLAHYHHPSQSLENGIGISFFERSSPARFLLLRTLLGAAVILPSGLACQAAKKHFYYEGEVVEDVFDVASRAIQQGRIIPYNKRIPGPIR